MRPIKFRAWDTKKKIMYSAEEMGRDQLTLSPDGRGFVNVSGTATKLSQYLPHLIPLQSTGKHDKNGKEIWAKSILAEPKDETKWNSGEAERIVVEYNDKLTRFLCQFNTIYGGEGYSGNIEGQQLCDYIKDGWVIIGNAHENPDLLKEQT